jgi:hypothetical protein
MMSLLSALVLLGTLVPAQSPPEGEGQLWQSATPFAAFLENVKARRDQWTSRFANAAVEADALNRARALPGRRRLLAIAEARCSDSAWAVPHLAKLAAAVPDKLELRVITPADGGARLQAVNLTPDGRRATPTIVVLDEQDRVLGAWVERPSELQQWYLANKETVAQADRYRHLDKWYTEDAGRTTVSEVLTLLERTEPKAPAGARDEGK